MVYFVILWHITRALFRTYFDLVALVLCFSCDGSSVGRSILGDFMVTLSVYKFWAFVFQSLVGYFWHLGRYLSEDVWLVHANILILLDSSGIVRAELALVILED